MSWSTPTCLPTDHRTKPTSEPSSLQQRAKGAPIRQQMTLTPQYPYLRQQPSDKRFSASAPPSRSRFLPGPKPTNLTFSQIGPRAARPQLRQPAPRHRHGISRSLASLRLRLHLCICQLPPNSIHCAQLLSLASVLISSRRPTARLSSVPLPRLTSRIHISHSLSKLTPLSHFSCAAVLSLPASLLSAATRRKVQAKEPAAAQPRPTTQQKVKRLLTRIHPNFFHSFPTPFLLPIGTSTYSCRIHNIRPGCRNENHGPPGHTLTFSSRKFILGQSPTWRRPSCKGLSTRRRKTWRTQEPQSQPRGMFLSELFTRITTGLTSSIFMFALPPPRTRILTAPSICSLFLAF